MQIYEHSDTAFPLFFGFSMSGIYYLVIVVGSV
ncbi:hypothetical protein T11_2904 [Trichinella zimbabwensis]|uniref:Uncharacterized protein n=1 Tax=Trichinella zimbabwensis TaxID=268475 RepID=A0A0V1DL02_9BILA|nr:hypothetical protein T11_2904 [Trichinella zimbabwensis]